MGSAVMALPMKKAAAPKKAMKVMKAAKAMKAMKVMKAMKAMKVMKVKVVSKIAKGKLARYTVFRGKKEKTQGGMTKANLVKNRRGKVVSKAASARAKKA